MSRWTSLVVLLIGCLSAISHADPGEELQPAPNQSVSIEKATPDAESEVAAAKPVTSSPRIQEDAVAEGIAANSPGNSRPPIFLGKKRPSVDAALETTAASTPWYRTSFGALSIVLGLIALLYLGLKRWAPSIKNHEPGLVQVLSRTVLGPRQSAVLLRVGERIVVVGMSPDRIDRICEITGADEVAAIASQAPLKNSAGQFSSWLDREAAQFAASSSTQGEEAQAGPRRGPRPLTDLLEKLRTVKV